MKNNKHHIRITLAACIAALGLVLAAPVSGALRAAAEEPLHKASRQEVQVRYLQVEDIHPQKLVRQVTPGNNLRVFLAETAQ